MQNKQRRRPMQAGDIKSQWLKEKEKPQQGLPAQKPLRAEDEPEEEAPPAKWKVFLWKIIVGILLVLAIAFVYIFLLLGEPEDEAQSMQTVNEEKIAFSMSPLEVPGESDAATLAESFGQPVLSLYPGVLPMERSRIYDTAFEGSFARRVTLTYTFETGETLYVDSLRPTAAIALLGGDDFRLDGERTYAIGGVDAAWMENSRVIVVFGQTAEAAYAVTCPISMKEQLPQLLRSTLLNTAPAQP